MGKIIAVCNQKGGCGKTTSALNFGTSLAEKGNIVLLVDFDPQGDLTLNCGVNEPDELEETISNPIMQLISGEENLQVPILSYRSKVDFIPANDTLSGMKMVMMQAMAREFLLKKILWPLREQYDYIIIDCAPSLDVDLINALAASDEVLITSAPSRFSKKGTERLLKSVMKVRENLNENLTVAGVLITKVDRRTNFTNDIIDMMRISWQEWVHIFETEIPSSVRVDESQAMALPVREYENGNKAAESYLKFTEEYLGLEVQ